MNMMKSGVTISLVPEAKGGPFIFWDDLASSCRTAARLGFDGVEVFPPAPELLDTTALRQALEENRLQLAALGTGGGWLRQKLTLTSPDATVRSRARDFISRMIDQAGPFGAAVIVGSMQGRAEGEVSRERALEFLGQALGEFGARARGAGVTLLYEPLNRYETNLFHRVEDLLPFLAALPAPVKILGDLFHMSIEESSVPDAIRAAGSRLGHVHLADSNRRAAGLGHTDFGPIFAALREIGYSGYLSAEALPGADSEQAAAQTLATFRRWAA